MSLNQEGLKGAGKPRSANSVASKYATVRPRLVMLNRRTRFDQIYRNGKPVRGDLLVLRILPNAMNLNRFGLSISREVGKATRRNKLRRQLKEIIRNEPFQDGWDVVIYVRTRASTAGFSELKNSLLNLANKAGIRKYFEKIGSETH